MNWELKKLDNLGTVSRGRSRHRPRDAAHLYGGPYPFIQTGDVKHSELFINSYSQTYSEAGLAQSKLWPKGTLCITIAANIADTSILDMEACFPDSIIGFIADEEKANTLFVKYLFDAVLQRRYKQFSHGATQDNLSQTKLLSIDFPVPSLPIQNRIASILSAYDELIQNNKRRIELLEKSAQLLYKEWFVQLRFPGHEHTKIKDGVPEGWEKIHLSEIVSTQYGYTESATEENVGPKFLRGTDINKTSYIDWSGVPYCPIKEQDYKKYELFEGDILAIRMADPGKVALIEEKVEAVFASYLVRLKILDKENYPPLFVFYTLVDNRYQGFISGASTGSTRKSASAKLLTDFDFIMPEDVILHEFIENISTIRNQIKTLVRQNGQLKKARDLLLPKLMNGDIPV